MASPSSGVRVTYLGTNGYLLEASDSTILIDPYFSRIALAPVASNSPIKPNIIRINSGMNRLAKRIDAILVTHGHFDHLLDVPEIARSHQGVRCRLADELLFVPSRRRTRLEDSSGPGWRLRALWRRKGPCP